MESIRDIAKRLIREHEIKTGKRIPYDEEDAIVKALKYSQVPAPLSNAIGAAIRVEQLNDGDRDWLERIGVRL